MAWLIWNPFVASKEILRLLGTYKMLDMHCRPSELLEIDDAYTAFCFDEACAYILSKLKDGEEPIIKEEETSQKTYAKPSDFYKKFD